MNKTLETLVAAITGGALWEGFKFLLPSIQRTIQNKRAASDTLYRNLDPILKSANELYGKLVSLSKEDFSTFTNPSNSISVNVDINKKYIFYLFSQFWAQLENLRLESQFTKLSRIKKGGELLKFIDTIESRKFRILDRSLQRIIGECLISTKDQKFKVMTLNEFMIQFEDVNSNLYKRVQYLQKALNGVRDKDKRQIVLRFGVVIAALIDHFDPKHQTVRERNIYTNKLSDKSKKLIKAVLLTQYLPFLKSKESYY